MAKRKNPSTAHKKSVDEVNIRVKYDVHEYGPVPPGVMTSRQLIEGGSSPKHCIAITSVGMRGDLGTMILMRGGVKETDEPLGEEHRVKRAFKIAANPGESKKPEFQERVAATAATFRKEYPEFLNMVIECWSPDMKKWMAYFVIDNERSLYDHPSFSDKELEEMDEMDRNVVVSIELVQEEIFTKFRESTLVSLDVTNLSYLTELRHTIIDFRKTCRNQARELMAIHHPCNLQLTLAAILIGMEDNLTKLIEDAAPVTRPGRWLLNIRGIAPVLAGDMIAQNWDYTLPSASHFISFAGINPKMVWKKGQTRPFSSDAKRAVMNIARSFTYQINSDAPNNYYGPILKRAKRQIVEKNEAGGFAELAKWYLENFDWKKDGPVNYYKAGKCPPSHLQAMAVRKVAQLFLNHFYHRLREMHGLPVPVPYVFQHATGHTEFIEPPPLVD